MWNYFLVWGWMIEKGVFGIVSHKGVVKGDWYFQVVNLLMIVFLVLLFCSILKIKSSIFRIILIIFIFYIGFVFFYVNYHSYLLAVKNNIEYERYLAIQGRYLFPVIGPFTVLMAFSFLHWFRNIYIKILIILLMGFFFVYNDFVTIYKNYKSWVFDTSASIMLGKDNVVVLSNIGDTSPAELFSLKYEEELIGGIAIYASTYGKNIEGGYRVNVYWSNCSSPLESVDIKQISDNKFFYVKFNQTLEPRNVYCFTVEKTSDKDIITLPFNAEVIRDHKKIIYNILDLKSLKLLDE